MEILDPKKEGKLCTLPGHGHAICAICTNQNCDKNSFCCVKCISFFHQACGNDIMFFEDIFNENATSFLAHPKMQGLEQQTSTSQAKCVTYDEFKKDYKDAVIEEVKTLKDNATKSTNQLIEKMGSIPQDELEKRLKDVYRDFSEKAKEGDAINNILQLETIRSNISDYMKVKDDPNTNATIKKFFTEYFEKLSSLEKNFSEMFWSVQVTSYGKKNCKDALEGIYRNFKDEISSPQLVDGLFSAVVAWKWDDKTKTQPQLKLSEDDTKVTRESGTGHCSVLGTSSFTKGKHIWEITPDGITHNNGDWVQFGLTVKQNGWDAFNTQSFASGNQNGGKNYYQNLDEFEGPIIDFNKKTFRCEQDADEGVLKIEGNGLKGKKGGLKGTEVWPFLNCYHTGNNGKLKVIK